LRLQAAVLLRICFTQPLSQFRFDRNVEPPHLFKKLPLDSSLLSILVESSLICERTELPSVEEGQGYVRKAIRGQNLDRAGLSGRHMKLMNLVTEPISIAEAATQLGWHEEEVQRVAHGFEMAELIEKVSLDDKTKVFGVVADGEQALKVRSFYQQSPEQVTGKLVRDSVGLKLLLRRSRPDVLLLEMGEETLELFDELAELLNDVRVIGIRSGDGIDSHEKVSAMLSTDCTVDSIRQAVLQETTTAVEG
jgi:hypothetical protein